MNKKNHEFMLPWVSLVHAGTHLPAALSHHLQEQLGISLAEQDLMSLLDRGGGELRMVDLAERLFFSKAAITKMVRRLEALGLLARRASPADGRVVLTHLTAAGQSTLQQSRTMLVTWVRENFAEPLGAAGVAQLGAALEQLLRAIGRWEGQSRHLAGYPPRSEKR